MLCVAITTADTWLGSFIVARTTPYMITGLGYGTYFVFGGVVMLMGIWAFFFVPETKGESPILYMECESVPLLTSPQVSRSSIWMLCSPSLPVRLSGQG